MSGSSPEGGKQPINSTVGLWGTPVKRFRVFKSFGEWHVVWPNQAFAWLRTSNYEQAREAVVAEIRKL